MSYGEGSAPKGPRGKSVRSHVHPWRGQDYIHTKYENGDWLWSRWVDGIQIFGLNGVELPLWRHERLATADATTPVLLCEGERDVLTAESLGFLATTVPSGALVNGKPWLSLYTKPLARYNTLIVVADNDASGQEHVATCATALRDLIQDLRVINFPDLQSPKKDLTDWVEAGHTADDTHALIAQAPQWAPPEWFDPIPIEGTVGPAFPTAALPDPFRSWAESVAASIQVPVALPCLLDLPIIGAACAKKFKVRTSPDHAEHLNVWTLVVLPSGERKSATFREAIRPVREWETARAEDMRHAVAEYGARVRAAKKAVDHAEDQFAKKKIGEDDLKTLVRELSDLERAPVVSPRVVVDDISPERLNDVMAEQKGRILIASPEGGTFDLMSGRYDPTKTPNLNIYLMGFSGDDNIVDRVGRVAKRVREPIISLAVTTQPEVLRGLARRPGFRGRGMIARMWFACPEGRAGYQISSPPPLDAEASRLRADAIRALLDLPIPETPHDLTLDPEATLHLATFHDAIQERMRPDGDLAHMRDWASRAVGAMTKVAGILHVMRHGLASWGKPISSETMLAAWAVTDFLVSHAMLAIGAMGMDETVHLAREVDAWVVRNGKTEFSERDLHRDMRRHVKHSADWQAPLRFLAERNHVREVPAPKKRGRPPTARYEVNPAVLAGGAS